MDWIQTKCRPLLGKWSEFNPAQKNQTRVATVPMWMQCSYNIVLNFTHFGKGGGSKILGIGRSWFFDSILNPCLQFLLTLLHVGVGIYAHPTTYQQFSPETLFLGGSKYTQISSFVITKHMKFVSGQKILLQRTEGCQSQVGSWFFAPFLPQNWW